MTVAPGPLFLLRSLPTLSLPPILTAFAFFALQQGALISVPTWIKAVAYVGSWPTTVLAALLLKDFKTRRAAAKAGAILAPSVPSRLPYGLDAIWTMITRPRNEEYPFHTVTNLAETMGTTCLRYVLLFDNPIFTFDPEHIKIILSTGFKNFPKGSNFTEVNKSVLGTGVFNADDDLWKFHRSITRPYFSRERIGHFDNFDKHATDAFKKMRLRLRLGHAVDFQDLINRVTLDTATAFLFGSDVCSLSADLPYPHEDPSIALSHPANAFATAFASALTVIHTRSPLGKKWPLREFWGDRSIPHMRVIRNFIDPIIEAAVRRRKEADHQKDKANEEADTLLDHLLENTDDMTVIRDEILNIMLAGRDTTASTLTFIVYMLAENPHVLRRLREEILGHLGPNGRPTPENLREMKYLRAVINETLRLYPVVPINVRTNAEATTLPPITPGGKPFYIPAKTRCVYSVLVMHRRKDLWGPDALEFDPDRFIDERLHKYLTRNPFIFLPFNAGPRICLGQQFAYNEMSFILVRLLQAFSSISLALDAQPANSMPPAEWKDGDVNSRRAQEKVWPSRHFTLFVKGGLWVRATEAETATEGEIEATVDERN